MRLVETLCIGCVWGAGDVLVHSNGAGCMLRYAAA
jgi:hypothetical protein